MLVYYIVYSISDVYQTIAVYHENYLNMNNYNQKRNFTLFYLKKKIKIKMIEMSFPHNFESHV